MIKKLKTFYSSRFSKSKNNPNNKSRGFTLIEFLVVLSLASVVVVYAAKELTYKNTISSYNNKIDLTIDEIEQIFNASNAYLTALDKWPDQENDCANAMHVLTGSASDIINSRYLLYMDNTTPMGTGYTISCPEPNRNLSITVAIALGSPAINVDYAQYMVNHIANSTLTVLSTSTIPPLRDGVIVSHSFPGGSSLTLGQFLRIDGSNQMLGTLTLADQNIIGAQDVILENGDKLSNLFGNVILQDIQTLRIIGRTATEYGVAIIVNEGYVDKPICFEPTPNPAIHLSVVGIVALGNKNPFANPPYINPRLSRGSAWNIRLDVFTEDGPVKAAVGTYIQAIILCTK